MGAKDARLTVAALGFHTAAEVEERQMLIVTGHGGRGQQAGRAVAGVGAADGAEGVFRTVHEVGAGPAVDVQVHEAGEEIAALEIDRFGAAGRPVVGGYGRDVIAVDADGGTVEDAIRQDDGTSLE
jgi:hypothetical protein